MHQKNKTELTALSVMGFGLLLFVPAAKIEAYALFLIALFIVACGLTILQVAINPYIIALGPEETGASRLNLGGALNSTATFIGPILGGAFILKDFKLSDFGGNHEMLNHAKADAVTGPYIILALVTVGIAAILYFTSLPEIATASDSDTESKGTGSALDFLHLKLGALGIFFYVGAEVAIGSLLILYLTEVDAETGKRLLELPATLTSGLDKEGIKDIHEKMASSLLALYWGSAMIGRFVGSALGQTIKAQTLLRAVTIIALALVTLSMFGFMVEARMDMAVLVMKTDGGFSMGFQKINIPVAAFLLVLVGLFNSVMWPAIFPLGIAKLGKYTSQGSGIMCTMIIGGAFIPLFQGWLAGSIGYQYSFFICLICYAYLLFFAVKGYKMGKIAHLKDDETASSVSDGFDLDKV